MSHNHHSHHNHRSRHSATPGTAPALLPAQEQGSTLGDMLLTALNFVPCFYFSFPTENSGICNKITLVGVYWELQCSSDLVKI